MCFGFGAFWGFGGFGVGFKALGILGFWCFGFRFCFFGFWCFALGLYGLLGFWCFGFRALGILGFWWFGLGLYGLLGFWLRL